MFEGDIYIKKAIYMPPYFNFIEIVFPIICKIAYEIFVTFM